MNCAIVLAAGRSTRMGTQKLLLPFAGTTVIAHVVDQLLGSVLDAVHVVTGHQADRVAAALAGRPVHLVTNPDVDAGMLSSVRCGVRSLPPDCRAMLVALGDQPAITRELVDAMVRSFGQAEGGILVPVFGGARGHPLLLAARYREEILTRHDDVGLRGLLRAHPDDVVELAAPTRAVLSDMDCPQDYRRALEAWRHGRP